MTEAQRFTVSVEFKTLDEALELARRLDEEGMSPSIDLGIEADVEVELDFDEEDGNVALY